MKNIEVYIVIVFLLILAGIVFLTLLRQKSRDNAQTGISSVSDIESQQADQSNSTSPQDAPESENVAPAGQDAEEAPSIETVDASVLTLQDKLNFPKPDMQIDPKRSYSAILKTSEGDIEMALNADETPVTANNFIALARAGFYSNVIFHRVIDGFMIQTGDPTGTGAGGPAYKFDDEAFNGGYTKGTVAMANSGPNTNGSQFFIMQGDMDLPKNYVIFGNVVNGMDVVDKIAKAEVGPNDSQEVSKPVSPVVINSVEISESDANN